MTGKTDNRENILLVANWESNVGYAWWLMENFWITIEKHFANQGKSSYLIYPKITLIPQTISSTDIKTSELDFSIHDHDNLMRIYRYIRANSIRYIYLSDSPTYSWFYLFLRLTGVKKIVVHDHTPGERSKPTYWLKMIKSFIQHIPYYTADHFIAVTDYVNKRHLEVNVIPKKKCSVASNGIHPIDLNQAETSYANKIFGIPENRIIVVTTGRASYYKGIDFFIHCADELVNKQKINQLHFLFCGDGPDMDAFKALCKELYLEDHFTFAGKRTDVRKILPSCDIGFHTAKGEVGYSLSILEYMSAGLATIVPDTPSTCSATRHLETGLIYPAGDKKAACESIDKCLTESFRKQLSDNAIKEVRTSYDINQTNEKLISILDSIYVRSN